MLRPADPDRQQLVQPLAVQNSRGARTLGRAALAESRNQIH
ncbi:hypothetical protein [Aureimonas sp. SA4125]|nr:hypothetical protein [Aureimonas sp. SA4125]